jgi:hypothetical protein
MPSPQKVLVFSIALIGYDRIFRHCINTHRAYCKRYDYDYILIDRFPGVPDKEEAAWLKILLTIEALKSGYEWVVYVDSDCEIRDWTPRIESLKMPEKYIYLVPGYSGFINSGVLIAECSIESIDFFEKVLNGVGQQISELSIIDWGENPYVIHQAKDNPYVHLLEHHQWNNNTNLDPKSYIIHYSSGTFRELYLSCYARPIDKLRAKIIRNIYNFYLHKLPKKASLKERLNQDVEFYHTRYPAFRSQSLRSVSAKFCI